jgi:hypothetical protein
VSTSEDDKCFSIKKLKKIKKLIKKIEKKKKKSGGWATLLTYPLDWPRPWQ